MTFCLNSQFYQAPPFTFINSLPGVSDRAVSYVVEFIFEAKLFMCGQHLLNIITSFLADVACIYFCFILLPKHPHYFTFSPPHDTVSPAIFCMILQSVPALKTKSLFIHVKHRCIATGVRNEFLTEFPFVCACASVSLSRCSFSLEVIKCSESADC